MHKVTFIVFVLHCVMCPEEVVSLDDLERNYCDLRRTESTNLLAIVSKQRNEKLASWVDSLPIPSLVYTHNAIVDSETNIRALYETSAHGSTGAFFQFVVDHYFCLPQYLLFIVGSNPYHPLDPSISSALVDLNKADQGYLALGHFSVAGPPVSTHPASAAFSSAVRGHRSAFVSEVT